MAKVVIMGAGIDGVLLTYELKAELGAAGVHRFPRGDMGGDLPCRHGR